jgi:hypothetical protein
MNEFITIIIHLTKNSKHIMKMFAIHQFPFLSQCLRGYFREVWTRGVLSYEWWAMSGNSHSYNVWYHQGKTKIQTPHCWWSGNSSSILCTWELVCHVCYFRLRHCTKFLEILWKHHKMLNIVHIMNYYYILARDIYIGL